MRCLLMPLLALLILFAVNAATPTAYALDAVPIAAATLYTDDEAAAFVAKLPDIKYPTTIDAACKTLGIDQTRLYKDGFMMSEVSGRAGHDWAQISPKYWISFQWVLLANNDVEFRKVLIYISPQKPATAPATQASDAQNKWLTQVIKDMKSIKVGMTRADLLKICDIQSGFSSRIHETFNYRGCALIHVHVTFKPVGNEPDKPDDVILEISEPSLGFPAWD